MTRADSQTIATALGQTDRGVRKRAAREGWPGTDVATRGGQRRMFDVAQLPADVQAALALSKRPASHQITEALADAGALPARLSLAPSDAEIASRSAAYARLPAGHRATAEGRLRALQAVDALVREGQPLTTARELVAARLTSQGEQTTAITLYRWQQLVDYVPRAQWLHFLAPRWSGRSTTADCEPAAWDAFKADYLRLEAPAAAACYDRLQRLAKVKGWTVPALKTLQRRLEREISPPAIVLARQGTEALMRMYPAQERDHGTFHALEAVNADGHKFDCFVRHPLGHICRPLLVAFHDIYSGKILSWRYGETESADQVRLAFSDLVRRYGIPRAAWLDNGRAFASKFITGGTASRYRFKVRPEDPTGIMVGLGVEIHWATPYHGQAKPIERAFRDLCETVAKHPEFAGAYVGNNPTAKPENYGSKAIDWDTFQRVADAEIAAHNAREGRRARVAAGRSFDQVFGESYAAATIRRATAEQLRDLLLSSDTVGASATDGSVRLAGNRYWTEALARHAGQRLMLRFDPDALHGSVHVYALDGTYIAEAECVARVGFADQAAATDHARARKQWRRAAKLQLEAERRMDVSKLADQLAELEPAPPELVQPKVVAGIFGTTTGRRIDAAGNVIDTATGQVVQPAPDPGELSEEEQQRHQWIAAQLERQRKNAL